MTHRCHWPSCDIEVPPQMWGCKSHWLKLPRTLRNKVWATYKPGQEIRKDPSEAYRKVAGEVQAWIVANGPRCELHGLLAADGKCDVCEERGIWEGITQPVVEGE